MGKWATMLPSFLQDAVRQTPLAQYNTQSYVLYGFVGTTRQSSDECKPSRLPLVLVEELRRVVGVGGENG